MCIRDRFYINDLFKQLTVQKNQSKITDVKTLDKADTSSITFLNSNDYIDLAKKTKASACITTSKLKQYLPNTCLTIVVKNVLLSIAEVSKKFYPNADIDYPDQTLIETNKLSSNFDSVTFGKNIFVGKNAKIGSNSTIGSNTIIEHDVQIGKNCIIGANVTLRNVLIGKEVVVQDGSKIGVKGFGFIPSKGKNFRFPHIGRVIINDNVEIGANCTIDRGSTVSYTHLTLPTKRIV